MESNAAQAPWNPLSPSEIASVFAEASFPWWLAGGYALELAVGQSWREHGDIDVLILRRDQKALQKLLRNWDCWIAGGEFRPWQQGESVPLDAHDIWCRKKETGPWQLQIMLDESDGDFWYSRRDGRIRRPIAELKVKGSAMPFLPPEVILYYKAKNPRPKDESDFKAVFPRLSAEQQAWLREAVVITYEEHPWCSPGL